MQGEIGSRWLSNFSTKLVLVVTLIVQCFNAKYQSNFELPLSCFTTFLYLFKRVAVSIQLHFGLTQHESGGFYCYCSRCHRCLTQLFCRLAWTLVHTPMTLLTIPVQKGHKRENDKVCRKYKWKGDRNEK